MSGWRQPVEVRPFFRRPSDGDLVAVAARAGVDLNPLEAHELAPIVNGLLDAVERLRLEEPLRAPQVRLDGRDPGRRPTRAEDPWNAFVRRCDVAGATEGLLSGRTVGVKDNIDVAGVPTSNASATQAYTPSTDAVVIERILTAGGRVVAKTNMDDYGAGASGETSAFGAPLNPIDPERSPGGSSGGSGAALAAGMVDLALGVDQAGSARIPASFCGVVAIKPTHGLVPSHGVTHLDHTLDAVCPMARTVEESALLLEAIAGEDWRDPQWVRGKLPAPAEIRQPVELRGLRIGVVRESTSASLCETAVVANLWRATEPLRTAGAQVSDVDVPTWPLGLPIAQTLLCHLVGAMIWSEGVGYGHLGLIDVERMHAFALARRQESRLLSPYMKVWILVESLLHDEYHNVSYGMLHNLRLRLRSDLDAAFENYDVLMTPTTPTTAPRLASGEELMSEVGRRILESLPYNTAPLNLSGHPVVALPSGSDAEGMPTSVQVIARRFHEAVALGVARAIEAAQS